MDEEGIKKSKLARVDFLGAFALVGLVLSCLLTLDQGTKGVTWRVVLPLGVAFVLFSAMFIIIEKSYAKEPVLPLDLISKRDVYLPYLIIACQAGGQFGVRKVPPAISISTHLYDADIFSLL